MLLTHWQVHQFIPSSKVKWKSELSPQGLCLYSELCLSNFQAINELVHLIYAMEH